MGTSRRMNGFIRLAALGAVAAVPVLLATAGAGGRHDGQPADPADTIRKMEEQRKKDNPTAAPTPPSAPAQAPATTPPASTPTQPAPATARPPVGATTEPATDTATTGTRLIRENTFITQRRGRMTRSLTNEWVFTIDADAKGKGEPAMVLMPCMNLQNMEKTVERAGEGTSFTVSGTVYVYKGRNYLLPSMYVVNRRSELSPAQ